jgi:hypothetical protein
MSSFEERYFDWALNWTLGEWHAGFPLLSEMSDPLAHRYVAFIRSLPENHQGQAVRALVRRFHSVSTDLQPLTPVEAVYIEQYLNSPVEFAKPRTVLQRIDTRRLKARLKRSFTKQSIVAESGSIILTLSLRKWDISTVIDVFSSPARIVYHHDIHRASLVYLAQRVSVLSWTGIAGQSEWQEFSDEDAVIENFLKVVSAFIDVAPKLVEEGRVAHLPTSPSTDESSR